MIWSENGRHGDGIWVFRLNLIFLFLEWGWGSRSRILYGFFVARRVRDHERVSVRMHRGSDGVYVSAVGIDYVGPDVWIEVQARVPVLLHVLYHRRRVLALEAGPFLWEMGCGYARLTVHDLWYDNEDSPLKTAKDLEEMKHQTELHLVERRSPVPVCGHRM